MKDSQDWYTRHGPSQPAPSNIQCTQYGADERAGCDERWVRGVLSALYFCCFIPRCDVLCGMRLVGVCNHVWVEVSEAAGRSRGGASSEQRLPAEVSVCEGGCDRSRADVAEVLMENGVNARCDQISSCRRIVGR